MTQPIQILSYSIKGYSGVGPDAIVLQFDGKHAALCGPNNSGKSAILSALSLLPHVFGGQELHVGYSASFIDLGWTQVAQATDDVFYRGLRRADFSIAFTAPKNGFSVSLPVPSDRDEVTVVADFSIQPGQKVLTAISVDGKSFLQLNREANLPQRVQPTDGNHTLGLIKSVRSLLSRFAVFSPHREIRSSGSAQDLSLMAQGLGLIEWVRDARNPNPQQSASVQQADLLAEFEAEFGEFADLPSFSLSVSQQMRLNVRLGSTLLPVERIGSGIGECLIILLVAKLARLRTPPIDVIAIDEPELHLHQKMQRKLVDFLANRDVQLILATHSPTVLNVVQRMDGRIFRTALRDAGDGKSISVSLVEETQEILALLKEIGASAGDILQAEKVLWVEGPTDVPVFKAWLTLAPSFADQVVAVVQLGGSAYASDSFDVSQLTKLNPNPFGNPRQRESERSRGP